MPYIPKETRGAFFDKKVLTGCQNLLLLFIDQKVVEVK